MDINCSALTLADRLDWLLWLSSQGYSNPLLTNPWGQNYSNSQFGMFQQLSILLLSFSSRRLQSLPLLSQSSSEVFLIFCVCFWTLRFWRVCQLERRVRNGILQSFICQKIGMNKYSEYSELIFLQFTKTYTW